MNKQLKKFVAVILVAILVCGMMPVAAIAADNALVYDLDISRSVVTNDVDQLVTISINFAEELSIDTVGYEVTWSDKLEFVSLKAGEGSNCAFTDDDLYVDDTMCLMGWTVNNAVTTSNIGVITVKVPAGTSAGNYTVNIDDIEVFGADAGIAAYDDSLSATITVEEPSAPSTGYEIWYELNKQDSDGDKYYEYGIGDIVTANVYMKSTEKDVIMQAYDIYLDYSNKLTYQSNNMAGSEIMENGKLSHVQLVKDNNKNITLTKGQAVSLGQIEFTIANTATHGEHLPIELTIGTNDKTVTNIAIAGDKTSYYPVNGGTTEGAEVNAVYTVTWNNQDGSNIETDTKVAHGTAFKDIAPADPTKDADETYTYTFAGWATAANQETGKMPAELGEVTADATYYAAFSKEAIEYTVTFTDDKGNKIETSGYNGTVELPDAADKEGYTFAGWYDGNDYVGVAGDTYTVKGNVTLTVMYDPNTYTVVFHPGQNATGSMDSQTFTYDEAFKELSANAFKHNDKNYVFAGWATTEGSNERAYSDKQSVQNLTAEANGVVNLYAIWKQDVYTITYVHPAGVTVTSELEGTYSSATGLTLEKNPEAIGYTFAGWYTDAEFQNKVTEIEAGETGAKTFYSKWDANEINVTLDYGYENKTGNLPVTFGATYYDEGLPTEPTREGYTFGGWYFNDKYEGNAVTDVTIVTDAEAHTLYAKWVPEEFTIIFMDSDRTTELGKITAAYESSVAAIADPIKTAYTFSKWVDVNGNEVTFPMTMPLDGTTVYASWTANTYTITFDLAGGELEEGVQNPMNYTIESKEKLPNATKANYEFDGWKVETADGNWAESVYNAGTAVTGQYGSVTLVAQWKVAFTYAIEEYKYANEGYVMLRIATDDAEKCYSFNGEKMFYTAEADYQLDVVENDQIVSKPVFVTLIPVMDGETALVDNYKLTEAGMAKLEKTEVTAVSIDRNGDINGDGVLNIADANTVYQMVETNSKGAYYTLEHLGIEARLKADMDTTVDSTTDDHRGSIEDVNAIVNMINGTSNDTN